MAATASNRALSVRLGLEADDFRRELEQIGADGQAQLARVGDVDLSALRQQFEQLGQAANGNLQAATVAIGTMNVQIVQAGQSLDRTAAAAEGFGARLSGTATVIKGAAAGLDEFLASAKSINDVLRASWAVRTVEDTFVDIGSAAADTAHEVDKVVERTIALRLAFAGLRSYGLAVPGLQEIIAIGIAVEKTVGFVGAAVSANDNYIASHKRLVEVLERTNSAAGLSAGAIELVARRQEAAGRSTRQTLQTAAEAIVAYKGTTEENFAAILAASDDLAAKLGKDVPDAAQTLVGWMGQGSAAFGAMEEAGIRVTYALEKQAVAFETAGDKAGAAGVVLDAVRASVGGTSGAIDESAQSVHRYEVAWTDLVTGVGALLGPFVEKLRAAWAFITAPIEWPRDIATAVMENVVDHLGSRPIAQQLERDQALLAQAIKERDRLLQDGSASAVEALSNAETNVYLLKQKVEKDKAGLAALGVDPDQVKADERKLRVALDDNARALDQWGTRLSDSLTKATGGPALDAQIKAINAEFEKTRTELDRHRNADGSNDIKVDALIEDARRLADARIKAAEDEAKAQAEANASVDEYADLLERLAEEGERLEKQRADRALQLFHQTVEAGLTPTQRYERQVAEMADALDLLRSKGFQPLPAEIAAINKAIGEQDPAFKEAQRQAEEYGTKIEQTAKQVSGDWSKAIFDGLTGNGKQQSILDWFKTLFKRIAVQALSANIVLPITTSIVGAVPGLFGISTPSGGTASGQTAAQGGAGGLLNSGVGQTVQAGQSIYSGLTGSTSSLMTSGAEWLATSQLGQGVGLSAVNQTAVGAIGPQIPGAVTMTPAGSSFASAAGAIGAAAPYGFLGGMGGALISNQYMGGSKVGGALTGAALGVGTYAAGTAITGALGMGAAASAAGVSGMAGATAALSAIPVYGWIAAAVLAAVTAAIGSKKPTVGPNAQGNVVYQDGRYVQGPSAADNGGDDSNVKTVTAAVAQGFNTLADTYGIKLKATNYGYWEGGTEAATGNGVHNDPKALIRKILGDAEASDPNSNVAKALSNSTVKASGDLEEIQTYLAVAAKIDSANEAFRELNKSLDQVQTTAKKAAADGFASIDEEIKTADKIDLGGEYRASLEQSIRSTFEGAVQAATPWETTMANARGETEAWIEAVTRWGVGVSEAEIRTDAAAKAAKLQAQAVAEWTASLYQAQGRDYLTTLTGIEANRDTVRRNFVAVGVGDAAGKADALVTAQLTAALKGLDLAQLTDVTTTLGGAIGALADSLRAAGQVAASEDLRVRALRAEGATAEADALERRLQQDREYQAAVTAGYDAPYLATMRYIQGLEKETAAKERAAAAAAYASDLQSRAYAAVGNDRTAQLLALDAQQAKALAEAKAAGYDTTLLAQVQAAERAARAFQLAQQDTTGALEQQIAATQDYITSLTDGAVKIAQSAREFRQAYDSLALNDNSPLNALDRLEEARQQVAKDYATYKDAAANDNDREAAKQDLLSLAPTLVQLAKSYFGSTNDGDYQWMRSILAEFGDASALGVDTAELQLKTANESLKELQRQRAEAAAQGQKTYGVLADLKNVQDMSYAVWQSALGPLQLLAGTSPTAARYAAPANVQSAWDQMSDAQRTAALRTAGYSQTVSDGYYAANMWVAAGHQGAFEQALLAAAHAAGIPGFATGGVVPQVAGSALGQDSVLAKLMPHEGVVNLRGMGVLGADGLATLNAGRWPANDRWAGNVTVVRPAAGASDAGTAALLVEMRRQNTLLERLVAVTAAGDAENATATRDAATLMTKTLSARTGRMTDPVGARLRTANG